MELKGKVAIVTGGAQGIGKAISLSLAELGADIVIADINEQRAMLTVDAVKALGRKALYIETDVSLEESVNKLYVGVLEKFGTVDILVNNAGICRAVPILDITVDEWDKIMAVNLRGTFLMCREALKIMKEKGAGKIVSLSSAAAKTGGVVAGAHYSASKAGIACFTKSLAHQAAPYKINVNAVSPGPISTEITAEWGESASGNLAQKIPWKEYGKPEDVANVVAFLVSEKSRYITGEIVDVNGGLGRD